MDGTGGIAAYRGDMVTRASIIFNPDTALAPPLDRVINAAPSVGVTVTLAPVHNDAGIEAAAAAQAREPGGGLMVLPDSFNVTHSGVIVAAAVRSKWHTTGSRVVRAKSYRPGSHIARSPDRAHGCSG